MWCIKYLFHGRTRVTAKNYALGPIYDLFMKLKQLILTLKSQSQVWLFTTRFFQSLSMEKYSSLPRISSPYILLLSSDTHYSFRSDNFWCLGEVPLLDSLNYSYKSLLCSSFEGAWEVPLLGTSYYSYNLIISSFHDLCCSDNSASYWSNVA